MLLSYIAVLLSLSRMKVAPPATDRKSDYSLRYLFDGIRYIAGRPHISALMIHLIVMALFGIPYLLVIPIFAKEVLQGDASTFGRLMACVGVGALLGGTLMAMRKTVRGLGKHMAITTAGFSVLIVGFSQTSTLWTSSLLIGAAGFAMVMAMIGSQTLAQTLVSEHIRGRVLSIYTMISVGMLPFGSLISGALAQQLGYELLLSSTVECAMVAAAVFALNLPRLRTAAYATEESRR